MQLLLFILSILFIRMIQCNPELLDYTQCDIRDQYNMETCFPFKENFIRDYLQKLGKNEKLKQINSIVSQYSKIKLEVMETQDKGLGIFLNQTLKKNQLIFKYNLRKIIGSQQINQKIFFQNTLYKNHEKLKISKKKLGLYIDDEELQKESLLMINLIYHFSRIEQSFLKQDLMGIPTTHSMIPFYKITPYEINLLQTKVEITQIKQIKQTAIDHYKKFINGQFIRSIFSSRQNQYILALNQLHNKEQFILFFQRDEIKFDVFLFCQYIAMSRNHISNRNSYIFPVLHYANQISNFHYLNYNLFEQKIKRKLHLHNSEQVQMQNQEFLINYGYGSFSIYAFYSGFVPQINGLQCYSLKIFDEQTATKHQIDSHYCLNSTTIPYITMYSLHEINSIHLQQCLQKISPQLRVQMNDMKQKDTEEIQQVLTSLWVECSQIQKNEKYFDIWINAKTILQNQKKILNENLQQLKWYYDIRLANQKDTQIALIFIDYQTNLYSKIEESENNLFQYLKQYNL